MNRRELRRALTELPSWSAALGFLLLATVLGCAVNDEPSCASCHHDCGFRREKCDAKCDASPACQPDGGEAAPDDAAAESSPSDGGIS